MGSVPGRSPSGCVHRKSKPRQRLLPSSFPREKKDRPDSRGASKVLINLLRQLQLLTSLLRSPSLPINRFERSGSSRPNDLGSWVAEHAGKEVEEDGDLVRVVEGDEKADIGGVELEDREEEVDVWLAKIAKRSCRCG